MILTSDVEKELKTYPTMYLDTALDSYIGRYGVKSLKVALELYWTLKAKED